MRQPRSGIWHQRVNNRELYANTTLSILYNRANSNILITIPVTYNKSYMFITVQVIYNPLGPGKIYSGKTEISNIS